MPGTRTREPAPAWSGFRPLTVTAITRESEAVISIRLEAPRTGRRFRLRARASTSRCESGPTSNADRCSATTPSPGPPEAGHYRITVKHERRGVASGYLHTRLELGDQLDIAAPRGTFILDDGTNAPVLLISAGIGAPPCSRCFHALAETHSDRELSVPARRTQQPRALVRRGGSRADRFAPERARARVLQPSLVQPMSKAATSTPQADSPIPAGPTGATSRRGGIPAGPAPSWMRSARAWRDRNRRHARPHRAVRPCAGPDPGHRGNTRTGASCTRRQPRSRTHDRVRTQQPRRPVGQRLRQPARARRSM